MARLLSLLLIVLAALVVGSFAHPSGKTRSEEELQEAFNFFDANSDGHITPTEAFVAWVNLGSNYTEEEVNDYVRTADSDGDGSVSYFEFLSLLAAPPS